MARISEAEQSQHSSHPICKLWGHYQALPRASVVASLHAMRSRAKKHPVLSLTRLERLALRHVATLMVKSPKKTSTEAERVAEIASQFMASVGVQSEEMVERGFGLARDMANAGDAKGFMFSAQGTKSFVAIARANYGMDAEASQGGNVTLNAIFARPLGPKQAEAIEEPALELEAAPEAASEPPDLDFE